MRCSSCSSPIADNTRFCGECGARVATVEATPTETSAGDISSGAWQSGNAPRFPAGTMFGGRYRIVGLLGRGGMGEVYRADDLTLGRPVALKFLPEEVEHDPRRLARFLNEVRVALRVSHVNVCRVHDIGQMDGRHFLSMEYVDGDDLSSLLRRIGRYPTDRAIQVARQLCAGLAAAHEQGVLHRDLKPANVMIDGRGQVKITDFGLAGLAEDLRGADLGAGTPAYMAPEQFEGREVSVRSDVYSLGLVLYELFTGSSAFDGRTPADLARSRQSGPTHPSSRVEGIDPAVERVILRCLESDPGLRPPSALAVAAALPGGDPLAAALAAGETPSPELLAEAGASGGLQPAIAFACFTALVALLGAGIWLSEKTSLVRRVPLDKPPAVLVEKAREVVVALGYPEPPVDSLYGFEPHRDYLAFLRRTRAPDVQGESPGMPSALHFVYRQSPTWFDRENAGSIGNWFNDPAPMRPGMIEVGLTTAGALVEFTAVPPHRDARPDAAEEPDWSFLFAAAGLDPGTFVPVDPAWVPATFADVRRAWERSDVGDSETRLRVEAASFEGRSVAFRVVGPWTRDATQVAPSPEFWPRAGQAVRAFWIVVVLIGAAFLAMRNLQQGRGDRRTALRLALYLGGVRLLWLVGAHHVTAASEVEILVGHLAWALYRVGLAYLFYLALEPYARRLWPHLLVSWVRLLSGRFRDPLVGRDVLVGALWGAFGSAVVLYSRYLAIENYGPAWTVWSLEALRGSRHAVGAVIGVHTASVLGLFIGVMMFLVVRLLLRRTWIAVVVFTALGALNFAPGEGDPLPFLIGFSVVMVSFWWMWLRFGLLSLLVGFSVFDLVQEMPLTFDVGAWHATPTLITLLLVLGVAAWGLRVALAGRPLFRDEILEAEAGAA